MTQIEKMLFIFLYVSIGLAARDTQFFVASSTFMVYGYFAGLMQCAIDDVMTTIRKGRS